MGRTVIRGIRCASRNLLLAVGLIACGPGVGEAESHGAAASGDSTGANSGILVSGTAACDLEPIGCFGDFPCDNLVIGDGVICQQSLPPGSGVRVVGDAECVLQRLRDRVISSLNLEDCSADNKQISDKITILGDDTALLSRIRVTDAMWGESTHEPDRRVVIKPPAYFDNCLQADDLAVVRDCLFNWFEPDQCVPEACCPVANNSDLPPC